MIRVAVRVARPEAEAVLAELLALVPAGLEERDLDASTVEYVLYGAPGELPDLGEVRAVAGGALVDVVTSALPDDWLERWRAFHQPLDAGSVRVRPPWAAPRPGGLDVVIDPGQAFGTGSHPSTRLILELLTGLEPRGPLADWGCGSGVLSVAAARLGFAPVASCDVDPASVAATESAARANGVHLAVSRCDLRAGPGPSAPTVLANLVRPLLLELAGHLGPPPERLLVSGLLAEEADEVAAAFVPCGLGERERNEGDGWAAIRLEGKGSS